MTTDTINRADTALGFDEIQAFLFAETRALDDRQWDTWLSFYHADCPFWMPAWDDEDQLTEDPQNEMSLIFYPDKSGIEDRVFRIQTDRSSSTSLPEPRTMHNLSNIEVLSQEGGEIKLRFNWITLTYRYGTTDQHWGTSFYTIDATGPKPLITNKKVVLKNDKIHHVIDVYHI
ncbi:2-halobenzoate 1,2-dioxygenase small subunit [Roseovarius gaetbuli]|uniref:2-halobenzoate 1,2-dioxygenase small subunit n=1 Tax=Roseovarius gaetbuli TaxID=1356575 RepID=A0A1X6Y7T4_9RHOB|nr:benzoate 1,2-dioxygenase small subunit [Roseovarius gaetbuli]SLN13322.1 2-halobenzoate 1,2-dioxygenase small subunit [Roseovarius gaetbuli]